MAENGYCELGDLRGAATGTWMAVPDNADDTLLDVMIEAASRAIDAECGRRFWQDPTARDRYYTPRPGESRLWVDDISTATGLVVVTDDDNDGTFETTWTRDTDYRLEPLNASEDDRPWTRISLIGAKAWPTTSRAVKITAKFGWAEVPKQVKTATMILTGDLWSMKDTRFGVATYGEFAARAVRQNGAVLMLIAPYVRMDLGAV